jgi:molybdate transport system substrate-binding protein
MASQSPRHVLVGLALTALGIVGTAGAAGAGTPGEHAPTVLLVFAAASLSDALEEVDRAFTARTGVQVNASYAASSLLAKQIEAGAPADAFFSADRAWVDYLDERGLLKRGSRRDVLGNALVLIAPADMALRLDITPGFDLAAALGEGRLATADPDSVPAGEYARAALTKLGVWQRVSGRLARGENVRAALAYVARGEAPTGHRVPDGRAGREARAGGRRLSRGHSPTHHLSGGADRQGSPRGGAARGLSDQRARAADFHPLRVCTAAGAPRRDELTLIHYHGNV